MQNKITGENFIFTGILIDVWQGLCQGEERIYLHVIKHQIIG